MAQALEPRTVAALLNASAAGISAQARALPAELCRWRPAPGDWSVNEVLGHFLEAEELGFAGRIRSLLAVEHPRLPGWDQEAVARARHDNTGDRNDLLAQFTALRQISVRLVTDLQQDQLERAGLQEEVGEISVLNLLHEWVYHDATHFKQLVSIIQEYAWMSMGNCQRFADIV